LIEKRFEGGRGVLAALGVQIEALACIISMDDKQIIFEDDQA
jgi:hypothetical protein